MDKKSTRIALGGMFSALCVTLMFMTGMVPFATYALPMAAGAMLIPVVVELGAKTAVMVYVSVSALSVMVVPDREAVLLFGVFFGYYPILKQSLERLRSRIVERILKLFLFNAAVAGSYYLVLAVLGMPDLLGELGGFGERSALVLMGIGNLMFVVYDFALTRYVTLYVRWFKPKFLGR